MPIILCTHTYTHKRIRKGKYVKYLVHINTWCGLWCIFFFSLFPFSFFFFRVLYELFIPFLSFFLLHTVSHSFISSSVCCCSQCLFSGNKLQFMLKMLALVNEAKKKKKSKFIEITPCIPNANTISIIFLYNILHLVWMPLSQLQ